MKQKTEIASQEISNSRNNEGNSAVLQASKLEWTGERMVPEVCDQDTFLEHVYRYKFAIPFTRDKDVLDIACGEGYGSAGLLAGGARSVVGVDIDPDTVEHARRKYNLEARVGSAELIPAADKTFDIIISFETIEHLANPGRFLDECVRVCRPGGRLIISTPNKMNYLSDSGSNEFHQSEMTPDDFTECLASRFKRFSIYGQCMSWSPWWNIRMLSVAGTPSLLNIPGACRIRSLFRRALAPRLSTGRYRASCQDTIKLMLERDSHFSDLFNPYLVRRVSMAEEMPAYMVAVADL
jgi:2-polyprenyl-3-methyl-5-hydroxy-6-metoxy-1,4-benzoquinol methylase